MCWSPGQRSPFFSQELVGALHGRKEEGSAAPTALPQLLEKEEEEKQERKKA